MAFDSSSNAQASRRPSPGNLPEAPRPNADIWNSLREDGLQWEGQVLIVGSGVEIPALLVLTDTRFALVSGGELALDVPRSWLRPEPKLLAGNGVRISITPQGGGGKADDVDRLSIRVREGRSGAARLVSAISGRLVSSREEHVVRTSDNAMGWGSTVGAAASIALPPLPDFDDDARARRSWPPIEQHAVPSATPSPASGQADKSHRGNSSTSISAWSAENLDVTSDPVPASMSRRSQRGSTTNSATSPNVPPPVLEEHHQFNRGLVWGLRSLILATLIGTGLYFGRESLPANINLSLPSTIEERFGLDQNEKNPEVSLVPVNGQQVGSNDSEETPEPTNANSDGTNGPPNGDKIGTMSGDEENGTGGQDGVLTPVNPGIGTYADPTEAPAVDDAANEPVDTGPVATEIPETVVTEEPVEPTSPPVTEVPATEVPVTEEPVTEVPATEIPATEVPATEIPATEEPTEIPVTETPVTETSSTETLATETPVTETPSTETPATEEPTEIPGRQDPIETPVNEVPTETPVTEAPAATLVSQPPSVDSGSTPEQSLANGTFRYTITGASRGETVPDLPDMNPVSGGEWVVLSVNGKNWSETEQVFDMSQFKLYADGKEVLLDVGNGWVSGLLGNTPAYGNTDAILWAADESHDFALTFLAPAGTEQLTLVAGDQMIDLSSALTDPQPLAQEENSTVAPEFIEATVVEVVSADEIVIEKDGIRQTVRYLGLDVPTDNDCYADDATSANRELVEGKTVRLERQATDVDARGNWVRDVWAPAEDGRYFLVSESLVSQGAATVGISDPNTRYEGWLLGSQSVAKAEQRGLWGACGEDGNAQLPSQAATVTPPLNRMNYHRQRS